MTQHKIHLYRLYLVAEGKCAFTGDTADALKFFKSVNYPCPDNFNPADHYIFTLAIVPGEEEECRKRVDVSLNLNSNGFVSYTRCKHGK